MLNKVFNFFKKTNKQSVEKVTSSEYLIDNLYDSLECYNIKINIGNDLIPLKNTIRENISRTREITKDKYGFIIPYIKIQSQANIQENEYQILINDKIIFNDFAIPTTTYIETDFIDSLSKTIDKNIDLIFTNQSVERYINFVQKENFWLVWNLTSILSTVEIKAILVDIIKNGKSINNINYIFEKICDDIFVENNTKNPHKISERLCKLL